MEDVTLGHAKEHLAELLARAAQGEDVRIADPAIGTVRLVPVTAGAYAGPRAVDAMPAFVARPRKRVPGRLAGKLPLPPDGFFDALDETELRHWHGEGG